MRASNVSPSAGNGIGGKQIWPIWGECVADTLAAACDFGHSIQILKSNICATTATQISFKGG